MRRRAMDQRFPRSQKRNLGYPAFALKGNS
jgi:hypothetical protein